MVTLGTVLAPSQLLYRTEEGVWRTLRDSILAGGGEKASILSDHPKGRLGLHGKPEVVRPRSREWGTKKVGEARRTLTDSRRPRDIITGRTQGVAQKPTSRGSS